MSLCLSLPPPITDPMTIDRCGISSHHFGLLKIFQAIIKTLSDAVCCIHVIVRYCHINQSINQSISVICRLQSPDARFCRQNPQILPLPRTPPPGADLREGAGRTAALPSLSPSSRHTVKGKRRKRMCARQENGLDTIAWLK